MHHSIVENVLLHRLEVWPLTEKPRGKLRTVEFNYLGLL
jgi:hypothetical protein